jgi:DNA-binding NarL/FixJ family response regulator
MPGGDRISTIRQIIASRPESRILVVTMFDDDASVFAAMRAEAHGYVLKDIDDEELSRALFAVDNAEAIFSAAIAGRMMRFFDQRPAAPQVAFPELSESERRVLQLIAQGENNQIIADRLAFSPKTVRNDISNIFVKLQVADRTQAIVKARDARGWPGSRSIKGDYARTPLSTRGGHSGRYRPGSGVVPCLQWVAGYLLDPFPPGWYRRATVLAPGCRKRVATIILTFTAQRVPRPRRHLVPRWAARVASLEGRPMMSLLV